MESVMFYLLQTATQNLILGFVPESLGLLIFGIGLIGVTVALRWLLRKSEAQSEAETENKAEAARG